MPENEFEKKVSSELGGLKLKPSDEVWMKVEERIRRKRKRRVFIIFFLVAGLALLGYWQRSYFFGGQKHELLNTKKKIENAAIDEPDRIADSVKISEPEPGSLTKTNKEEKLTGIKSNTETLILPEPEKQSKQPKTFVITSSVRSSGIFVKNKKDSVSKVVIETDKEKDITTEKQKKINPEAETFVLQKMNDVQDARKEERLQSEIENKEVISDSETSHSLGSFIGTTENKDSILNNEGSKDSAVNIVQKKNINKKWKWGIEIAPGIASLNDAFFTLNMNKSADAYANPNAGSGAVVLPAKPSNSTSGFSLQAGVFMKRQFTKRSSLSVGLRYAYYSNVLHTGTRRQTSSGTLNQFLDQRGAGAAFGAQGDTLRYLNQFHFIELPVYYHWQLNKNSDKPFSLQAGIKAGGMFASNALVYDTISGGIYYKSNKLFNKTQLGISAGLSKTFAGNKRFRWSIGAVAELHVNSLLDNPLDKKQYLFFFGLRSAILFNQKK